MTLMLTIAAPFRHSRKNELRKNEIVYFYVYTRKWMNADQATRVIARALEEHLLEPDREMLRPAFDLSTIEIPIGYRPSSAILARDDAYMDLVRRIEEQTGHNEQEVTARVNRIIGSGFDGNIRPEAAIVLLARELDVPFADLAERLRDQLKRSA